MKQLRTGLMFLILAGSLSANAQSSSPATQPAGFNQGSITVNNNTYKGHVKDNIKKNSEVVFVNGDGVKKTYNAAQLSSVTIEGNKYVVIASVFYKIVAEGPKVILFRQASSASTIQYNGAEPVAAASGGGTYNDYFIQPVNGGQMQLVTKREFRKLAETFSDCPAIAADIKANKYSFADIEKVVRAYNECQ